MLGCIESIHLLYVWGCEKWVLLIKLAGFLCVGSKKEDKVCHGWSLLSHVRCIWLEQIIEWFLRKRLMKTCFKRGSS